MWGNVTWFSGEMGETKDLQGDIGTFMGIPVVFTAGSFAIPNSASSFRVGYGHDNMSWQLSRF
jgi:hypothetical protein